MLTGQLFLIFGLFRFASAARRLRADACRGAATYGGFLRRRAGGDASLGGGVSLPTPGRSQEDRQCERAGEVRRQEDDGDELHSGGPGGIRAAGPAG